MNYDAGRLDENNMSLKAECTSKTLGFTLNLLENDESEYEERDVVLVDGDIVHIGAIPKNCYVNDITILMVEAFDAGTTLDLGFIGDYPDDNLTVFQSGIVVDESNVSIKIPLPISGVRNPDGSAAVSGVAGGIWNGDGRPMPLAVGVNATGVLTVGKCKVLISYARYDTNNGDGVS